MNDYIKTTKALSDTTRVRALMTLSSGELCLCQIIDILHLAPSTVSKHMNILYEAGLVEKRKQGRWQYFRINPNPNPHIQQILNWTMNTLGNNPKILADQDSRNKVTTTDLKELCECYKK